MTSVSLKSSSSTTTRFCGQMSHPEWKCCGTRTIPMTEHSKVRWSRAYYRQHRPTFYHSNILARDATVMRGRAARACADLGASSSALPVRRVRERIPASILKMSRARRMAWGFKRCSVHFLAKLKGKARWAHRVVSTPSLSPRRKADRGRGRPLIARYLKDG